MGLSQVIPNADFSGMRLALREANIPIYPDGFEAAFIGEKYVLATGKIIEPLTPDGSKDPGPTTFAGVTQDNMPLVSTSTIMGAKPSIYFKNDSVATRTKSLFYLMNHTGNKLSMSFCFGNQNSIAITVVRILFHIQMTNGNSLAFETSGVNSKLAVVINGVRTELVTVATLSTMFRVRLEYDGVNVKVWVNNVLDSTIPASFTNFVGTFYIASNNIGSTSTRMHGYLGSLYIWKRNLTDAEGTMVANQLLTAYTAAAI